MPRTDPVGGQDLNIREGFKYCQLLHWYNERPLNLGAPKQKTEQKSCRAQQGKNQENQHLFKNDLHPILSEISTDYDNIIVEFAFFEKPVVRASRKV